MVHDCGCIPLDVVYLSNVTQSNVANVNVAQVILI